MSRGQLVYDGGMTEEGAGGSPSLLAVDGEGQRDVERVVVLHQRGVLVVQHQLLQRAVQVVGLRETKTGARLVDDAVLHLSFHTEGDKEGERERQREREEVRSESHNQPSK